MEFEDEVSVKDIVNFYIKINDASKAKRDFAQFSSKDKVTAFGLIETSSAQRDFKIEIAKFFIYDLDARIRTKAEYMLEDLVPGWVSDPAESILKLLKAAEDKGPAQRDAAVRFLFGIVDANSLRDTFITLLNSRNRSHMAEILAILEDYIDASRDEQEQVRIFEACLDIVLSDDTDQNIKFHASNLLSVFFKKVAATSLGETLRQKYIERQVEKAEGVYRYLCSGASGLNAAFLEDLLRPLNEGGKVYQLKLVGYFGFVLEKVRIPEEIDTALDTYPDYWNQHELPKEEKIRHICGRILKALEELWYKTDDSEVRALIIKTKFAGYPNKRELLEQIKGRIEGESLSSTAREKISLMLQCFLQPSQDDTFKLQATHLMLFKLKGEENQIIALDYLRFYLEHRHLNYAEKGSIAAVVQELLKESDPEASIAAKARYLLFLAAPEAFAGEEQQRVILNDLRGLAEGIGFGDREAEDQVLQALADLRKVLVLEKYKKATLYLESKIKAPRTGHARTRARRSSLS